MFMAEKTIKVSEEIYSILESLRKDDESIEKVLLRLLPIKKTAISKEDFFGKWVGSTKELDSILAKINTAWKDWSNSLQT